MLNPVGFSNARVGGAMILWGFRGASARLYGQLYQGGHRLWRPHPDVALLRAGCCDVSL